MSLCNVLPNAYIYIYSFIIYTMFYIVFIGFLTFSNPFLPVRLVCSDCPRLQPQRLFWVDLRPSTSNSMDWIVDDVAHHCTHLACARPWSSSLKVLVSVLSWRQKNKVEMLKCWKFTRGKLKKTSQLLLFACFPSLFPWFGAHKSLAKAMAPSSDSTRTEHALASARSKTHGSSCRDVWLCLTCLASTSSKARCRSISVNFHALFDSLHHTAGIPSSIQQT